MSDEAHSPEAEAQAGLFGVEEGHWPAVSRDAADARAEVRMVYHDPDGCWWFDSESDEPWVPQCLGCLLTRQPHVAEVADLPLDWAAWREDGGWRRGPRPQEWGPGGEPGARPRGLARVASSL